MSEKIGNWIGLFPDWLQLITIPIFILLALLFVPVGGGETLGTIIFDFVTRKRGEKK